MKHFLIYTNCHKDKGMAMTERIRGYLESHGHKCTVILQNKGDGNHHDMNTEDHAPADAYCMIVLGGDGTMLQAAWDVKKTNIPLIGVNLGTLGYMTEVEPGCLNEALDQLMSGEVLSESRMMLNGKVLYQDGGVMEDWSLNDIVISRSGALQVIKAQYLRERAIPQRLQRRRRDYHHSHRLHRLQPVRGRPYSGALRPAHHHDPHLPPYPQQPKHYSVPGGCN